MNATVPVPRLLKRWLLYPGHPGSTPRRYGFGEPLAAPWQDVFVYTPRPFEVRIDYRPRGWWGLSLQRSAPRKADGGYSASGGLIHHTPHHNLYFDLGRRRFTLRRTTAWIEVRR